MSPLPKVLAWAHQRQRGGAGLVVAMLWVLRSLIVCEVVLLWLDLAPHLWAGLLAIEHRPGGAEVLFTLLGVAFLVSRSIGWHRQRGCAVARVADSYGTGVAVSRSDTATVDTHSLTRRARHEAAHAITAWALGATNLQTDVLEIGDRGGQCSYELSGDLAPVEVAWLGLVVSVAGNHVDITDGHYDQGAGNDLSKALVAAAAILSTGRHPAGVQCPLTTDHLLAAARVRAAELLRLNQARMDTMVDRLVNESPVLRGIPTVDPTADSPLVQGLVAVPECASKIDRVFP